MKINEPTFFSLNLKPTTASKLGKYERFLTGFEQELIKPFKQEKADEYYWHHQRQLEQSALEFLPKETHSRQDRFVSYPEKTHQARLPKVIARVQIELTQLKSWQEQKASRNVEEHSYCKPVCTFKPLSATQHKPCLPNQEMNKSTAAHLSKLLPPSGSGLPHAAFTNKIVFKRYQLFISDDSAELSLGTKETNQQATKELAHLIKLWFRNKKLKLQLLIIEGVKQ